MEESKKEKIIEQVKKELIEKEILRVSLLCNYLEEKKTNIVKKLSVSERKFWDYINKDFHYEYIYKSFEELLYAYIDDNTKNSMLGAKQFISKDLKEHLEQKEIIYSHLLYLNNIQALLRDYYKYNLKQNLCVIPINNEMLIDFDTWFIILIFNKKYYQLTLSDILE